MNKKFYKFAILNIRIPKNLFMVYQWSFTAILSFFLHESRNWLSPKFLATTIDVLVRLWEGKKKVSSLRERGASLTHSPQSRTLGGVLAIFLTTLPYFASGWSPRV